MTTLEKIKLEITSHFLWDGEVKTDIPYTVQVCLDIIDKYAEQEPTDVYDKVLAYLKANVDDFPDYHEAIEKVLELQSVRPQEQTGHWIVHEKPHGIRYLECPYCNIWYLNEHLIRNSFCPNCGAKMESEG